MQSSTDTLEELFNSAADAEDHNRYLTVVDTENIGGAQFPR